MTKSDIKILAHIHLYHSAERGAFMKIKTLVEETGIKSQNVNRAIRNLKEVDLLRPDDDIPGCFRLPVNGKSNTLQGGKDKWNVIEHYLSTGGWPDDKECINPDTSSVSGDSKGVRADSKCINPDTSSVSGDTDSRSPRARASEHLLTPLNTSLEGTPQPAVGGSGFFEIKGPGTEEEDVDFETRRCEYLAGMSPEDREKFKSLKLERLKGS